MTAGLIIMHLAGTFVTFQHLALWRFVEGDDSPDAWDFLICLVAWEVMALGVMLTDLKTEEKK